jgi:hypothetical protein
MARGADGAAGLAKLFDAGTKNTPPAVAAASQQYRALKAAARDDVRVDYAYAVVLANQRKYAEAIPLLMRYIKAQPADVGAISTIAWVFVQEKRPADALAACGAFGRRIPNDLPAQPKPELAAAAELVGGLFAYLEIVRPDTVDARSLAARKNEVVARLSEGYLQAFDRGRVVVTARLDALEAEHGEKQKQAEELARQRQDRTRSLLDESKQKAAVETKALQASTTQLQDAQRELALIQQQLSTSARDREQLAAQIITLETQFQQLNQSTQNNPATRRSTTTRNTIDAGAYAQASSIAVTLAGLNKQVFELDNKILGMQSRAAELTARLRVEGQSRAESMAIANKELKRAGTLEKQVARTKVAAPRAFVPVGRAASIATYVAFPYAQERDRVLGWFK